MSLHTPDRWTVLRLKQKDGTFEYKVLASFYGGFVGSNSWRLSSGTKETFEFDDYFEFHQYSGTIYRGYKDRYGMSMYTQGVLAEWLRNPEAADNVTPLNLEDINELH